MLYIGLFAPHIWYTL